jgi:hypothetical protein
MSHRISDLHGNTNLTRPFAVSAIMIGHILKICPTGQIRDVTLLLNDWTMSLRKINSDGPIKQIFQIPV